jgi:two-component system cell cycle response regulator
MTARILVVDDVDFNVKLLDAKLKQDYYQVFTASNGVQAVAKAKEIKPDLILMDVMMPEMDGFEATQIIKSDPNLSFIPIIIVTALNAQEDKVRGLEAGADDFLTKPINDKALMTRLKSLVRLKVMDDELRLRDQTGREFGVIQRGVETRNKVEGASALIIDDDKLQYRRISEKLWDIGVKCTQKEVIDDLLNGVDETDYSLIMISALLLDNDGLRFCSELRSVDKYRHTPILIIVDENDDETLTRALELGVNDYLLSPIDANEMVARCVTQIKRKRYQDDLKSNYLSSIKQSVVDALTNLYNRRYLETHIRNMIDNSQFAEDSVALLMIDIDYFKTVNDTYGHQSGDAVLAEVAKRLSDNLRITDLCARYGGEEFVAILASINPSLANSIAERIRVNIESKPFSIPVEPFSISCSLSIGLTFFHDGDNLDTLLKRGDQNLYKAKQSGRNKVVSDYDGVSEEKN